MGGHDQSDLFTRPLNGRFYDNQFLAPTGENWHTPPSFCALAFHNRLEVNILLAFFYWVWIALHPDLLSLI